MKLQLIKTENYLVAVSDYIESSYCFVLNKDEILKVKASSENELFHDKGWNLKTEAPFITHHLPLNNEPVLDGVELLPEFDDEATLLVEEFKISYKTVGLTDYEVSAFIIGYNKAKEKYKFTEGDMRKALFECCNTVFQKATVGKNTEKLYFNYEVENIINKIKEPKYPKYFNTETNQYSYE